MSTLAIGAAKPEKDTALGAFELRWVTVWGVWVPPGHMPGLLVDLMDKGHTVRERGHTVMTETDPDNLNHVNEVREAIRTYAEGSWNVNG